MSSSPAPPTYQSRKSRVQRLLSQRAQETQQDHDSCWLLSETLDHALHDIGPLRHLQCEVGEGQAELGENRF